MQGRESFESSAVLATRWPSLSCLTKLLTAQPPLAPVRLSAHKSRHAPRRPRPNLRRHAGRLFRPPRRRSGLAGGLALAARRYRRGLSACRLAGQRSGGRRGRACGAVAWPAGDRRRHRNHGRRGRPARLVRRRPLGGSRQQERWRCLPPRSSAQPDLGRRRRRRPRLRHVANVARRPPDPGAGAGPHHRPFPGPSTSSGTTRCTSAWAASTPYGASARSRIATTSPSSRSSAPTFATRR